MQRSPWRKALSITACIVAYAAVFERSEAQAFDFFGLFGSKETAPAPSLQALPYVLTFAIDGDKKAVEQTLQDASTLYRLRADPPSDGDFACPSRAG